MYVADMADDKRVERVPLLLTKKELEKLDDWQFTHRVRTRSDAVRVLMEKGYGAEEAAEAKKPKKDGDKP